ncbi:hypothetical protein AD006_28375 (plasmid) [Pseudonocardia sp. EC080610-09]|uniref:VOC family protein n=1 Tax=unclassified Pseudonocardia TaxID=2619320 RepID=UPI000706039B|nr:MULTISPECIES: VOC family protein [unclassified Pseudonocardia]ALL79252.1 hypothetical protein AD006_28375 [Pseudonocardia sp. EC080610-09]ALL85222.1 hypothetical protein AD017_28765 [Pseudonocardia sp. EC080619-01]
MTDTAQRHLVPWRLGYVALDVADLSAAARWWTRFGQLEIADQTDDTIYLRGGTDHHWLILHRATGTPGVRRMAFEVHTRSDLETYRDRLKNEGVEIAEHPGDRTGDAIRFADPDGYEIELFADMGNVGVEPTAPWINPTELLHAVVAVSDLDASVDFYGRVLGLLESDRVLGRTVFLRAGNGFHHALVLGFGRGAPPLLDHVALHLNDVDDLMRVRQNLIENTDGEPFDRDMLRHPTSGSMGFYAAGPGEVPLSVEFCIDHGKITDPDHRPRAMAPGRWTSNVWRPPVDTDA